MRILACDTSNSACSACLYEDGRILAQSFLSLGLTHSHTFMPMVHDLMKLSGFTYQDLDAFACTVGPGSFTGIRIGVSAVKVMAMASDKAAIPVSSLEALAYPLFGHKDTLVLASFDARNRRVFSSGYYDGQQVISEDARTSDELLRISADWIRANQPSAKILVCGNAWDSFAATADQSLLENVSEEHSNREIAPSSVAALAYALAVSNTKSPAASLFLPQDLMPVYRAKTSAERMFPDAPAAKLPEAAAIELPEKTAEGTKDANHD